VASYERETVEFWAGYSELLMRSGRAITSSVSNTQLGKRPAFRAMFSRLRRIVSKIAMPNRQEWVRVQAGIGAGIWLSVNVAKEKNWWSGSHEEVVQQRLQECVRPGMVFYDVGAHIGFFTLAAARLGAVVVAFEADPENAQRLRTHIEKNGFARDITPVEAAVWSHRQPKVLFRRGLPLSQGGVSDAGTEPVLAKEGPTIEVDCVTLDDFVAAGGPAPHVIKVDVEGGEAQVLQGAVRSVLDFHPDLIIEVHHRAALAEVEEFLKQYSYAAQWHVPREGYPRQCFAVHRTT
jgi:FkbM family methyltransferase